MKYGLSPSTIEKIRAVFRRFPEIEKAVLYGSRAKGNFKPGSDIDLTLHGEALTGALLSTISSALDDLLLPYTIDLSIFEELDHAKLREHIERVGVVFYERGNGGKRPGASMKTRWETKELAAVSAINYGYTESASCEPVGPRFLRITDIQDDRVDWDSVPYCKIETANLPKYRLASGDIVFARTGATTGKSFLVDTPPAAVFASYLIRLRLTDKKLLPEFVSLFFQTDSYWQSIKDGSSGSAQGGFNATKLGALKIPVPPLPEQQRIVGLLDEAFAGIATAKANAEKNLQNTRALFESHLRSVFTERGKGWVEKPLSELCERITKGSSPRWQGISYVAEPGVLFVTSENVGQFRLLMESPKYVEERFNEIERKSILRKGDVLTNLVGGSIGRTAIYDLRDGANINQAVGIIRCVPELLSNEYLTFLLNSPVFTQMMHDNEVNNARANISLTFVSSIPILCPPISEQARVVGKLNAFRCQIQRLESIYQQKLVALSALQKSFLHKAFGGEL